MPIIAISGLADWNPDILRVRCPSIAHVIDKEHRELDDRTHRSQLNLTGLFVVAREVHFHGLVPSEDPEDRMITLVQQAP